MAKNYFPQAIQNLAESLARLPGIGPRSAERLTMAMFNWKSTDLQILAEQLCQLHEKVVVCENCGNLADTELCFICSDPRRDRALLCIVETFLQIPVIEKSSSFKGLYHVLGGRLAPLDGMGPENLNLQSLKKRINEDKVQEIILATSPDMEGQATAHFLADLFKDDDVTISRIALGIPVGADLSFADSASMAMAINQRREID